MQQNIINYTIRRTTNGNNTIIILKLLEVYTGTMFHKCMWCDGVPHPQFVFVSELCEFCMWRDRVHHPPRASLCLSASCVSSARNRVHHPPRASLCLSASCVSSACDRVHHPPRASLCLSASCVSSARDRVHHPPRASLCLSASCVSSACDVTEYTTDLEPVCVCQRAVWVLHVTWQSTPPT